MRRDVLLKIFGWFLVGVASVWVFLTAVVFIKLVVTGGINVN